ncbi:MAG: hypothetical protein ACRDQ4_04125 [Pseudonocardiaceae bacterium]
MTSINGAGVIVDIELYDHTGQKVPCGQAAYLSQNILPGQAQAYPRANPPSLQQGQEYTLKVGVFKSPPNPGDSWGQLLYWNNQVELFIA